MLPYLLLIIMIPGFFLTAGSPPGTTPHVDTYTSSGTFTCPATLVGTVKVELWGSGGKGSTRTTTGGGGGGGGGEYIRKDAWACTPSNTYSYVVGAGSGTTNTTLTDGATVYTAHYGASVANNTTTGGTGGTSGGSCTGDVCYNGGYGHSFSSVGAGGGGSGGSGAAGNFTTLVNASDINGASSVTDGGPGGNGASGSNSVGSAPISGPGGGGGGARRSSGTRAGGAGYAGQIRFTYTTSP